MMVYVYPLPAPPRSTGWRKEVEGRNHDPAHTHPRTHKRINKYVRVEITMYSFSFRPPSSSVLFLRRRSSRLSFAGPLIICGHRRVAACDTTARLASTETRPMELGGAVRNEFPLLIIETIKT